MTASITLQSHKKQERFQYSGLTKTDYNNIGTELILTGSIYKRLQSAPSD